MSSPKVFTFGLGKIGIHLRGEFSNEDISLSHEDVILKGTDLFILPQQDLMPGDVYQLIIDKNTIVDRAGNAFVFLPEHQNYYKFRTMMAIRFERSESARLATNKMWPAVAVNDDNDIVIAGGIGYTDTSDSSSEVITASTSTGVTNTVEHLVTHRDTSCVEKKIQKS